MRSEWVRIGISSMALILVSLGLTLLKAEIAFAANPSGRAAAISTVADAKSAPATIAPGTAITMENWRQFKQFMPDGMAALFEGRYFWKMPPDVRMVVGPTVIHPLPKNYLAATEKFSSQTKIVALPDGGRTISGYGGGVPFPAPAAPDQGWKILADYWYRYFPHLVVNTPDNLGFSCTQDPYGSINCLKSLWVYRQLSFNTDPGVPATIPGGEGKFYTIWAMVEEPEQAKYTTTLTIGYADLSKPQDIFEFKPALRRTERLSSAARCATSGSDTTPDDGRFGFNGNIPEFNATLAGERKILSQMNVGTAGGRFPEDYDMALGWPKPSWGKWELRDVYVIDVRKIPARVQGYCYGKRIMYIDKQFYGALWEDLYNAEMKLWKVALLQPIVLKVPGIGMQNLTGAQYSHYWDVRNNHATYSGPADGHGYDVLINQDAPKEYEDIERYTTPGGLTGVMR